MAVRLPDPPLRPFRPGDVEAIVQHADDYEVWRRLRVYAVTRPDAGGRSGV